MDGFSFLKSREFSAGYVDVEIHESMRCTTGAPFLLYPIISTPVGDLLAGDVVDVPVAYCQVSSRMTYNVMVAGMLVLTTGEIRRATTDRTEWGTFYELSEAVGFNIDNNMHHYPVQRAGRFVMPADMPNAYASLVVYAASSSHDGVSLLKVDKDFGRLCGAVHRAVKREELAEFIGAVPAPAPAPEPPPPAPEPPPAPPPAPELVTLQITPTQAVALQEVAAQIPTA